MDRWILFAWWLLLVGVSALPFSPNIATRDLVPEPPTNDSFYDSSDNYHAEPPGTILSYRKVPAPIAAISLVPVPLKEAWQIKYRSTDSFGNPTASITTVLIPMINPDYSKLLTYQVAEDASYLNCAPSYAFQFLSKPGGPLGTALTQAEVISISLALLNGWIVTIPDHGGPKAAFLAQTSAGHMTLDATRATLNSADFTGVHPDANNVMWGYSGGASASVSAAELITSYAPELQPRIMGVAVGGTVPNITSAVFLLNKSAAAGLIPTGITGLANEYSEVAAMMDDPDIVRPDMLDELRTAGERCFIANLLSYTGQDVFTRFFVNPSFEAQTTLIKYFEQNALGNRAPPTPMFIYKSIQDEISAIADTDQVYDTYCAGGTSVEYRRDLASDHTVLFFTGIPAAFLWLKDRMDGKSVAAQCTRKDVVTSLADTSGLIPQSVTDALEKLTNEAKSNPSNMMLMF